MPGIQRLRDGDGFRYRRPNGRALRDPKELQRIRQLAIPPAYEEVWICPLPQGHLQATGRDARGRKQYRYHPGWREARDAHKFERMREFGLALPRIRAKVKRDLAAPVGSRASVLAALVRLLDTTLVRIGNDEYTRENGSYGLTTLRNRHAAVKGSHLQLRFRGKSGVWHEVALDDPQVARIVRACQAMPGQELFQYEDEAGQTRCVGSADVNDYLKALSGAEFSAKDFRTWHASVHALARLCALPNPGPVSRRVANDVLREVAGLLGNTLAVCRKSYVHPGVMARAAEAGVAGLLACEPRRRRGLTAAECRLVGFLSTAPGPSNGPRKTASGGGGSGRDGGGRR
ncbi:MAG: DNA topoisomerase IB [Rhizobacter sp.]|nr:DNA topoisomerase IB [Rhizobacter sp.]